MLHLIQHHLVLLHASSRVNDRIGSSDLLDSGGWVPRSLQVYHQWCAGGQRGAHPTRTCLRGHFHKNCNQQPTNRSTQMSAPNMLLAPRLNWTNHQRALHTTFDNQYEHKKTNTKYQNTTWLTNKHTPRLTFETPPSSVPYQVPSEKYITIHMLSNFAQHIKFLTHHIIVLHSLDNIWKFPDNIWHVFDNIDMLCNYYTTYT